MPRSLRRPVEDFEAVFRAVSQQRNDPIVLVGGHAVNVWALSYRDRLGGELDGYLPLTSGDMDFHGTRNALVALHQELGGKLQLSGPREIMDGTLVLGIEPDTREIDLLRSVHGIPKIGKEDAISLIICGHEVPVLFPHILLQGKLANALRLNQGTRQDVKHVHILALVVREFLKEIVVTATSGNERPALSLLQQSLDVLLSEDAKEFSGRYGFRSDDIMPIELLQNSPLPRLARFAQKVLPHRWAALG